MQPRPPQPNHTDAPDDPLSEFLRDPAGVLGSLLDRMLGWLPADGLAVSGLLAAVAVAGMLGRVGWWRWSQARLTTGASIVAVAVPPSVDPEGAAGLWSNLTGLLRPTWRRLLLGQPHVCFEYAFDAHGLEVRIWVPGCVPTGMIIHAVEAAWPGARTHTRPATDHPPLRRTSRDISLVVGGRLRLARPEALPLRTDFPTDPLRALLAAPGPLYDTDRVLVQALARPVTGRRAAHARHSTTTHTKVAVRLPAAILAAVATGLFALLTTRSKPRPHPSGAARAGGRPGQPAHQATLADQARDRAIVAKQTGPLYETTVRYTTTGQQSRDAAGSAVRERLRGRAHAIASAFELFAGHNHYRRHRLRRAEQALNSRRLGRGDLLSVAELAAIAHLPTDDHIAGLERAGANALAPPSAVPTAGPTVKPLGDSDAGPRRPVGIDVADARQHLHIMGATGSGKSELLAGMILADAEAGRGLVAVDPKGDLIVDVLARLPEHVADRVVLFDAGARRPPPCLNPLDDAGADPARTVDNLVSVFSRVYADSWGPRTDDILRASLLTLTQQPLGETTTLLDLPALLSQPATRDRLTAGLDDPMLAGFWAWYDRLTDAAQAAVIAPLMNKLRGFLLRPFVRQAVAAGASTVNLTDLLDAGGICLVRIPAGILGPQTSNLFGSLIVAQTWQTATARADQPPHQRRDAGLYLDEAHSFLNLPYALDDMLAQARGYRLSLTLAHQNLTQLPREIADGIATNARTKIYFTTGPDDAARLARHTHPHLSEHDLAHLGAFQVAVRPMVNDRAMHAFTATTRKLPPPIPGRTQAVRATAAGNHRPAVPNAPTAATEAPPPSGGRTSPIRDPRRR